MGSEMCIRDSSLLFVLWAPNAMDCLGESSVLPISTPERSVMQTTRARSFVTQEEYFGGCLREKLRENGTSSELHNAGPMDTGLLSSLVPFVLWIGGTFCWWGLRGRLWYRSTRHLWPCFLVASPFGGLNVPKLPPHDKQWCCFRASPGSRKYKAVRVAPCFPENPCAVCGKACGLTDRELDRQRHPCGLGCGCRCACIGCKYTNAGECERVLCEDTVPEDVVGNTVASVAAGGLSAIATALTNVSRSVEQLTRQQVERQQRRQQQAPVPAEMRRGYAPQPPQPCLLYTSPSPRDLSTSRMPSSA